MIRPYVVYDDAGNIVKTGFCPESMVFSQAGWDESAIEGRADDSLQYVDIQEEAVKDRPEMPAEIDKTVIGADGVDQATITGLPVANMNGVEIVTTVWLGDERYGVDDGEVVFSTDTPGEYEIRCEADTYLSAVFVIEAK